MPRRYNTKRKLLLIAGDCAAAIIAVTVAGLSGSLSGAYPPLLMLLAFLGGCFVSDLYNLLPLGYRFVASRYLSRYILGTGLGTAAAAFIYYISPQRDPDWGAFLRSFLLLGALAFAWRLLFRRIYILRRRKALIAVI